MSSLFSFGTLSPRTQHAITAVVSGAVVASTVLGIQALRQQIKVEELKASIPASDDAESATVPDFHVDAARPLLTQYDAAAKDDERAARLARRALEGDYDEELIAEQLTRTSSFLTPAGLAAVRSARVVVVGLGGVGSHCVTALARSGVGHLRIIDFDLVTLSSLNRHAVATLADVGTPKVTCLRRRLEAVAPWVHWECYNEAWREGADGERLLSGHVDCVVDAIDNIDTKVALLRFCKASGLRVISSMGAGCKSDPTRVLVGDVSASSEDPLSRSTRRRLRLCGVSEGIPVVYSTEKPGRGKATLLPLPDDEWQNGRVHELGPLPGFRARILPVLGTMPAVFGYVAANWVLMELSDHPHEATTGKGREKLYETVLQQVQAMEERLCRSHGDDVLGLRLAITKDDVGYLLDEIFRGKSVVSGLATRLTLIRWSAPTGGYHATRDYPGQVSARLALDDLVCMTKEEAAIHEQTILLGPDGARPEDVYDAAVVERVQQRFEEEVVENRYR